MATSTPKDKKDEGKLKVQSLLFEALEADGNNYLGWSIKVKTHLAAEELGEAINPEAKDVLAYVQSKALLILRRHIDYSLRNQYLLVEKPDELRKKLKLRFFHEKTIHLPQARNNWIQLQVLDFLNLLSFNAELHHIVIQLRMCSQTEEESELIDKTLSTFCFAAALLAQQYRNMKFSTHAKLMTYLLGAKKQQQVLLQNGERRPPAREAHTMEMAASKPKGYKGKQPYNSKPQFVKSRNKTYQNPNRTDSRPTQGNQSGGNNHQRRRNDGIGPEMRSCHKCGRKGHLANSCRTPEYFINIYKELQQLKARHPKAHALDAPMPEATENFMVSDLAPAFAVNSGLASNSNVDGKGTSLRESWLAHSGQELALLDSATTHTILQDFLYF